MYATLASVLVTSPPTQPHARKALRKSLRKSFFQRERVLVHEHQPWRSHDGSEEFFHREKLYRSISEKCVRGISLTGAASPIYINIGRVEASGEQLFSPKNTMASEKRKRHLTAPLPERSDAVRRRAAKRNRIFFFLL